MSDIIVSICCQTYNHVNYIEKCIKGFLIQKTTFKFEILIRDDASNDGTSDIIKKYSKQFPDIIFPIIKTNNTFSKGILPLNENLNRARGKYIAICEGDDFWIDPLKLEKQVYLLENNNNFGLIYTDVKIINSNDEELLSNHKLTLVNKFNENHDNVDFFDILNFNPISTPTVIFRKSLLDSISINKSWYIFDWWYWLHISSISEIVKFPEITTCYRIHDYGISNENNSFIKLRQSLVLQSSIKFYLSNNNLFILNFRKNFILLKRLLNIIFDLNINFISKKSSFIVLISNLQYLFIASFYGLIYFIYNKLKKFIYKYYKLLIRSKLLCLK